MANQTHFLAGIAASAIGKSEQAVKKLTLEIFKGVVMTSPVDKGVFRGSWAVTYGSAPFGVLDRLDKEGDETIREAVAKIRAIPFGDRPIYIYNNLPYGPRLERGWSSKQAPAGMVGVTLARINAKYGASLPKGEGL